MDTQEQNEVEAIVADELATMAASRLTEIARGLRKLADRVDGRTESGMGLLLTRFVFLSTEW